MNPDDRAGSRAPLARRETVVVQMTGTATPATTARRSRWQLVGVAASAVIALLYGALYAGVLALEGASAGERGILGVAAAVFVILTALLWWKPNRLVLAAGAALQLLLGWMYIAIAPDRDPPFEVWGVSIRVVSLALLIALVSLLVADHRERSATGDAPASE
jgi:hypothetical protein